MHNTFCLNRVNDIIPIEIIYKSKDNLGRTDIDTLWYSSYWIPCVVVGNL